MAGPTIIDGKGRDLRAPEIVKGGEITELINESVRASVRQTGVVPVEGEVGLPTIADVTGTADVTPQAVYLGTPGMDKALELMHRGGGSVLQQAQDDSIAMSLPEDSMVEVSASLWTRVKAGAMSLLRDMLLPYAPIFMNSLADWTEPDPNTGARRYKPYFASGGAVERAFLFFLATDAVAWNFAIPFQQNFRDMDCQIDSTGRTVKGRLLIEELAYWDRIQQDPSFSGTAAEALMMAGGAENVLKPMLNKAIVIHRKNLEANGKITFGSEVKRWRANAEAALWWITRHVFNGDPGRLSDNAFLDEKWLVHFSEGLVEGRTIVAVYVYTMKEMIDALSSMRGKGLSFWDAFVIGGKSIELVIKEFVSGWGARFESAWGVESVAFLEAPHLMKELEDHLELMGIPPTDAHSLVFPPSRDLTELISGAKAHGIGGLILSRVMTSGDAIDPDTGMFTRKFWDEIVVYEGKEYKMKDLALAMAYFLSANRSSDDPIPPGPVLQNMVRSIGGYDAVMRRFLSNRPELLFNGMRTYLRESMIDAAMKTLEDLQSELSQALDGSYEGNVEAFKSAIISGRFGIQTGDLEPIYGRQIVAEFLAAYMVMYEGEYAGHLLSRPDLILDMKGGFESSIDLMLKWLESGE